MTALVVLGLLLIALGVVSRLVAHWLYGRISSSPTRDVTPSALPGAPWFAVESDRAALKLIVTLTYGAVVAGIVLVALGLLL